ncbi:MAG: CPBP family intramembrane metalloprotease, partial [Chloroflexi bacterium]|nr:CPBP family intramembrane metalloprotease [Chloroflexota bacterium]
LGVVRPTPGQLVAGVRLILLLVVLQGLAGWLWTLLDPEEAAVLDDLNAVLLGDINTVWDWLLLALATGVGEELLFRGAIQPAFGLGLTAFLFAVAHVQYGLTPVTVFVFILGLILGLVRRRYNTTTAIFIHTGYNFALGLLALLATWLQQFVE